MNLRLFTAVFPSPEAITAINSFVVKLRKQLEPDWRWTSPQTWHLTTAFMASVSIIDLKTFTSQLAAITAELPCFNIEIGGAVCFPSKQTARTLALGVKRGSSSLSRLSKLCWETANQVSSIPTDNRFLPHLTLARSPRMIDVRPWVQKIQPFTVGDWLATELVLVESVLATSRPYFKVLSRFPFYADPAS